MIISFILDLFYRLLNGLVGLLPSGSIPSSVSDSITNIWGMVNAFSYVIALDTFIIVLLLVLAFDGIVLLWHLIQWIIRKIPGMQ